MKKFLLAIPTLFLATFIFLTPSAQAQCTIDSSLSSPGFSPNPLPNGCKNQPYSQDVSFLFPNDTIVPIPFPPFTLQIPFDSFVVDAVLNIPAGLSYTCNIGNCIYVTNPPNPTYGCVNVSGTPTDTTAVTDSIRVIGVAWVTILGSPTSFADTVNIGLKIDDCGAAVDPSLAGLMHFNVSPNPISADTRVSFNLSQSGQINLNLTDIFGREVFSVHNGFSMAGEFTTNLSGLPQTGPGIYFLNLYIDGVPSVSEKVISVF